MKLESPVERSPSGSRISYAQNMEDILLDRVLGGRVGTFVDVGANHPFIDNNTYYFYVRGWRGVNIEPTARGHALFARHRPDDTNLQLAASDAEGELAFYEVDDADGLTGLSTLSAETAAEHRAAGKSVAERRVPVRTLASIVAERSIPEPDLLSVDVEGHEAAVLRGIDLDRWRPKVLVIEATMPLDREPTHQGWEPALIEKGYHFAAFNGVNRFYLRDDLRPELEKLRVPVSVLDNYLRHELVALKLRSDALEEAVHRVVAERDADRVAQAELRSSWEWGQAQARHAQAVWEQELAAIRRERLAWEEADAWFKGAQAHWEAETRRLGRRVEEVERLCGDLQAERDALLAERDASLGQLSETQRLLRPYRLIDRMGVVTKGYGLARRLRRRLGKRPA